MTSLATGRVPPSILSRKGRSRPLIKWMGLPLALPTSRQSSKGLLACFHVFITTYTQVKNWGQAAEVKSARQTRHLLLLVEHHEEQHWQGPLQDSYTCQLLRAPFLLAGEQRKTYSPVGKLEIYFQCECFNYVYFLTLAIGRRLCLQRGA